MVYCIIKHKLCKTRVVDSLFAVLWHQGLAYLVRVGCVKTPAIVVERRTIFHNLDLAWTTF